MGKEPAIQILPYLLGFFVFCGRRLQRKHAACQGINLLPGSRLQSHRLVFNQSSSLERVAAQESWTHDLVFKPSISSNVLSTLSDVCCKAAQLVPHRKWLKPFDKKSAETRRARFSSAGLASRSRLFVQKIFRLSDASEG